MRALALSLLLAAPAAAQESAQFLKLGVGARALGMGGAYTAMGDDVNALAWNPAGLSSLAKKELGATHAELAAGTRYDFVGYAQPTQYGTWGAGAVYLSQGSIGGRDAAGKPTGSFGASDAALSFGFAAKMGSGLRLGSTVKYITSTLAERSARTYAIDAGGQYELSRLGPGVPRVGLAIQNLGPGMRYLDERSPLPLTVAAGVGYRLPAGLILAVDYKNRPNTRDSEFSIGTEYAVLSSFALRAGYGTTRAASNGARGAVFSGMAGGFGLKSAGYSLDYSMSPFGELGNVQRFSLGCRF